MLVKECNAKECRPESSPRSATSDLGLHVIEKTVGIFFIHLKKALVIWYCYDSEQTEAQADHILVFI